MKFEVINNNGQVVMWTDSIECIPTPDELDSMTSAGYHYKIDGKVVAKNKIHEAVGSTMSAASVVSKDSQKVTHKSKNGKLVSCKLF